LHPIDEKGIYPDTKDFLESIKIPVITEWWNLIYIEQGTVGFMYGDTTMILNTGDALFVKPFISHNLFLINEDKSFIYYMLSFNVSSTLMDTIAGKKHKLLSYMKKYLMKSFNEIINSLSDPAYKNYPSKRTNIFLKRSIIKPTAQMCWQQYICQYLELIIIELARKSPETATVGLQKTYDVKRLTADVINFLEANIYKKTTISEICKNFSYSRSRLSELFKVDCGYSIMEYYNLLKISEAKKLISENLTFTQIAEMLCFSSEQYFSRVLRNALH